jgi:glycerol-3-phosphate acyltransferase PlsY
VIALAAAAAYVVGAIPVGYLIARAFGIGDIRRRGSGNIGATNVLRTAGRLPAILTLAGDVAKGYAAVAVAGAVGEGAPRALAVGAVAAVAGNCWSVFLGFRGGKGVATGLGALLRLTPLATAAALPVFLVVVVTTRFVSLGSLLGAVCVPLGAWALGAPRPAVLGAVAVAAIVVLRHHENIARLRAGTERRLGGRRAPGAEAPAP